MKRRLPYGISISLATLALAGLVGKLAWAKEQEARFSDVTVRTGRVGCEVELDGVAAGKTDAHGELALREVDPSDHYLHVRCPGEQERATFISPRAGETFEVPVEFTATPGASRATSRADSGLAAAQVKIELRRLVQQAIQARAQGRFDEAVGNLREAFKLDPENSDLHRELGITFLLDKDWKRARVEMLEAIRHEPDDADAHNGLGYALDKLGDVKGAIREFRLATRLEPDDTSYRQHYLEALAKLAEQQAPKKNSGSPEERTRPQRH